MADLSVRRRNVRKAPVAALRLRVHAHFGCEDNFNATHLPDGYVPFRIVSLQSIRRLWDFRRARQPGKGEFSPVIIVLSRGSHRTSEWLGIVRKFVYIQCCPQASFNPLLIVLLTPKA